jgi:hypothetical protein
MQRCAAIMVCSRQTNAGVQVNTYLPEQVQLLRAPAKCCFIFKTLHAEALLAVHQMRMSTAARQVYQESQHA